MYTLGINAAYHDPAACLVRDGRVDRRGGGGAVHPHQARQAAGAVLDLGAALPRHRLLPASRPGITPGRRGPRRLLATTRTCCSAATATTPRSRCRCSRARSRRRRVGVALGPAVPVVDRQRPGAARSTAPRTTCRTGSGAPARRRRSAGTSSPHHLAHAASAFHASPFERAAVMTLDGRGERATTGYAVGDGDRPGMARPGPHAALARHPLRAGDRLPRLPALVRRVQGDGPGLVRQAALRRPSSATSIRLGAGRASTRSSRPGWRSGSARPGCAAGRSSSGTSTSPTRSRSCWKRRCWSWPAGCTGRPGATTSAWPAAWR